jgi:hypothetical protein
MIITDCTLDGILVEETSVEGWIKWVLGWVFVCLNDSLVFLFPCLLLVSFAGWRLHSELILHLTDNARDPGNREMRVSMRRRRMAHEQHHVLGTR